MNILFVGGGRRFELAAQFIKHGYKVYGYESNMDTPLSFMCEILLGCRWSDPHIDDHLWACIQEKDCLALPLQDAAIPILANFGHKRCVAPGRLPSHICYDKKKLEEFMMHNFSMYYPSCITGRSGYVIKPRHGFGSSGVVHVNVEYNEEDDVVQRRVYGEEYTVDAYFSKFDHRMIGAVPRIRTRVAGGEVIDSTTVDKPQLSNITKMIGEQLGLSGPSCFQYIIDAYTKRPYLIEINARFGGGATLSLEAGFDMIDMITTEYVEDKPIEKRYPWKEGLRMQRTMRDHFSGRDNETKN
jgi:hypothetical protein